MNAPFLLIPGLNGSARLFQAQIPVLWSWGAVMVADHRHAETVQGLAEQILSNAPERFSLVGFSLGGFIAFEILRRVPERVERLVLLSSSATPKVEDAAARQLREDRMAMALGGRFPELAPLHYPNNVHPDRHRDSELRALHRAMMNDVGPQGYVNQQRAIVSRPDCRPLLPTIACPTLIVVGDSDQLTPPARAQEMHRDIPGSRLVVASHCGHLSPLEAPQVVNEALVSWLTST